MALLALGELGGDEFAGGVAHHLVVEAGDELVEQRAVAEQEARLQDGGADGHVRLGLADAFVDRAGGVADFQAGVPQAIEDALGDLLAPGGLLVGQHEQQIDVGAGRLQPAAVAAGGDHRHALGLGGVIRRVEMLARELEQQADDGVFHLAQPFGAAAAVAVLQQQLLGLGAALDQRGFEPLRHGRAQLLLAAGMVLGELIELGGDGAHVDQVARAPLGWSAGARGAVSTASELMDQSWVNPDSGGGGGSHRLAAKIFVDPAISSPSAAFPVPAGDFRDRMTGARGLWFPAGRKNK